jgi:hypothetical protein
MLRAPNIALFVISGCLAIMGILASLPISLPIPGLSSASAWYIFDAWFLLALGSILPRPPASEENRESSNAYAPTGA